METVEKFISIGNERYYYKELTLVPNAKKLNLDIAKENLQIFHSIIEKTNIKYGLMYGTLLGAIREKNFIAHDCDTDIFILSEEKESFLKLLFQFRDHGFELIRNSYGVISIMRKNEYIDINVFKPKMKYGIIKFRVCNNDFECTAEYLENPIRYLFLGMSTFVPKNPEKFLRKTYGKNWETPIENLPASNNTLYKRISRFAPIFKNLPFYTSMEKIIKGLLKGMGL
jgi:lipopolysaccharide cholinephosphotransferase